MKPESLIFDIDGTLWDTRALVAQGYNIQLRREGLDHLCIDADTLTPLFGKVLTEIADILFVSIPAPERYALMKRCMDTEQEFMGTDPCHVGYPKVKETLEKLAEKYRLFIVSNSEQGYPGAVHRKNGPYGSDPGPPVLWRHPDIQGTDDPAADERTPYPLRCVYRRYPGGLSCHPGSGHPLCLRDLWSRKGGSLGRED